MCLLQIYIQPVNDDNMLCVAHTCFNLLGKNRFNFKILQILIILSHFRLAAIQIERETKV